MSRKIKFRVWAMPEGHYLDAMTPAFGYAMAAYLAGAMNSADQRAEFDEKIVLEQFTGLKDAKGQDIYEGDIVTTTPSGSCINSLLFSEEFVTYTHGEVVWEAGSWKVRQPHLGLTFLYDFVDCECCPTGSIEVIGNIREHFHLLNS